MAQDLNQCQFIGRLGRDPETRYTANGDACTNFSIAVGESWTDKASGEKQERVEWVRCTAWRRRAEVVGEYLKKGSQVYVSGKMQTRKWTDKDGADRYTTEIIVDRMQMLGSPRHDEESSEPQRPARAETQGAAKPADRPSRSFDDMDDDIPF